MRLQSATGKHLSFSTIKPLILLLWLGTAAQPASGQASGSAAENGGVVNESANPMLYGGSGEWGDLLFRYQYHTRGFGEEAGLGSLGINKSWLFGQFVFFADGSFRIDDDQLRPPTPSAGCGFRVIHSGWFGEESERIFGANFWYDGTHVDAVNSTDNYCYFQQFGVGLESLGETWDFRANANFPIGSTSFIGEKTQFGSLAFNEHELTANFSQFGRYAVTSVEGEVARRIGQRNLWAFASCYGLDGGGDQAIGAKVGIRGYLTKDVAASLSVANDGMFDTTVMFSITWFLDWGARGRAEMAPACIADRLREPVQRNDYVAVHDKTMTGLEAITDASGTPLYFVHVNSNAASSGDGTYEHPYKTLALAQGNSSVGDYVFLQQNSVFNGQSITLKNMQSLLGEGVAHTVFAYEFGKPTYLTLPDRGGPIPIIENVAGSAVTLANNNVVSGLTIENVVNGITAPSGTTNAAIDRVTVSNASGAGLNFQAAGGTITVDTYAYSGSAGTGVDIGGSSGIFTLTNINISSGASDAVSLTSNTGAITFNGLNIATTTGRGFVASGGGTLAVTGSSNTISTGAALGAGLDLNGVTIGGSGMAFQSVTTTGATHGISLVDVGGSTIAVSGGTISNSTDAGILVNGGRPQAVINAAIDNSANYAVDVENMTGTTGNVRIGGAITDSGKGILVQNNAGGAVVLHWRHDA